MPGSARAGSRQANAKACDMASKPINAGAANKSKVHDMTSKTINAGAAISAWAGSRQGGWLNLQALWAAVLRGFQVPQLAGFMGRFAEGGIKASSAGRAETSLAVAEQVKSASLAAEPRPVVVSSPCAASIAPPVSMPSAPPHPPRRQLRTRRPPAPAPAVHPHPQTPLEPPPHAPPPARSPHRSRRLLQGPSVARPGQPAAASRLRAVAGCCRVSAHVFRWRRGNRPRRDEQLGRADAAESAASGKPGGPPARALGAERRGEETARCLAIGAYFLY